MEGSGHDSHCQKPYMFFSYSDAFMYDTELMDSFITAGVFSLEYFIYDLQKRQSTFKCSLPS